MVACSSAFGYTYMEYECGYILAEYRDGFIFQPFDNKMEA
jgi:hypothetical protein